MTLYATYDYRERAHKFREEKIAYEKWKLTPAGQDSEAKNRSLTNGGAVIISTTGHRFYRGDKCSGDCSGHIAGYQWAMQYGITNVDACKNTPSSSFYQGCLRAAEDIISEIESNKSWEDGGYVFEP